MEAQWNIKFEGVTSINNIWNTTNTTAQAGAEPGRIQEALAGFAKGA